MLRLLGAEGRGHVGGLRAVPGNRHGPSPVPSSPHLTLHQSLSFRPNLSLSLSRPPPLLLFFRSFLRLHIQEHCQAQLRQLSLGLGPLPRGLRSGSGLGLGLGSGSVLGSGLGLG